MTLFLRKNKSSVFSKRGAFFYYYSFNKDNSFAYVVKETLAQFIRYERSLFNLRIHIVQKGDILSEIAQKYNVDFEELVQMNPQLSSPDMIMPGMKIKIPSESKQVQSDVNKADRKDIRNTVKDQKADVDMEGKTTERPMGNMIEDDHVERKPIQAEVPRNYEPLYSVKSNTQAPQIPKHANMEGVLSGFNNGTENKQHQLTEADQKQKQMNSYMHHHQMHRPQSMQPPMTPPMQQSMQPSMTLPLSPSMQQVNQPSMSPPMSLPMPLSMQTHERPMMYGCCCHCRQPMFAPRQPFYSYPWNQRSPYLPPRHY